MVAHKLDPLKVATFALLVKNGMTKTNAAKEAKIGWATVMRQLKEPTSALTIALAELGIFTGGIPSWENYKPLAQKALKDFGFFREYFFARSTSPWAQEAANKIVELLATPQEEYLVINVGPGAGKSTLFTHDIPAWILARSRDKSIMIGSASQNLANGYVNRLRTTLERTKPEKADHKLVELGLAHDAKSTLPLSYGRFRPVGAGQWSRSQFDIEQIDGQSRNEKEASVAGFGMDAGYLGGRYDFIIWDDLVTNATLRTEVAREKLISDWENQAETRLEPEGLLVLQGQRLGPNDLYRYCLNLKGVQEIDASGYDDTEVKKYHHIVFKAHYEEKCEGEHARSAKAYPQGCLLDPRRLSWQKLRTIQINKEGTFRTVYQQEDIATGDNLVEMAWIDGGADSRGYMMPGCWDEERSSGVVPQGVKGTSVITADPSVSNYWGLIWWLYDPDTKFQHLIDLKREQMSASDFLDWDYTNNCFTGALETWWQESNQQGRPITVLIMEENAAHKYLSQYNHFKRWQSERGVKLKPHTTGRNKSDPKYGVQTIGPYYRHGMVRLPGNKFDGSRQLVKQLVKEVTEWPNGLTDDLVMSHWFLVWNARSFLASDNLGAPTEQYPSWVKEMGF
jgi:hypothetical protein